PPVTTGLKQGETVAESVGKTIKASRAVKGATDAIKAGFETAAEVREAVGVASRATFGTVAGVAMFVIETSIEVGMAQHALQQSIDELATLPSLAAQAVSNPLDIRTQLSSQDGVVKVMTMFVAATLPEFSA